MDWVRTTTLRGAIRHAGTEVTRDTQNPVVIEAMFTWTQAPGDATGLQLLLFRLSPSYMWVTLHKRKGQQLDQVVMQEGIILQDDEGVHWAAAAPMLSTTSRVSLKQTATK